MRCGWAGPLDYLSPTLAGVDLERAWWERSVVEACDLRNCNLRGSVWTGAVFRRCDLRGADLGHVHETLRRTDISTARFEQCDLRGAHIPVDAGGTFIECPR